MLEPLSHQSTDSSEVPTKQPHERISRLWSFVRDNPHRLHMTVLVPSGSVKNIHVATTLAGVRKGMHGIWTYDTLLWLYCWNHWAISWLMAQWFQLVQLALGREGVLHVHNRPAVDVDVVSRDWVPHGWFRRIKLVLLVNARDDGKLLDRQSARFSESQNNMILNSTLNTTYSDILEGCVLVGPQNAHFLYLATAY